jgi:hypothetical protein
MDIFISVVLTLFLILTYDYVRVYRILTQSIQKEFDRLEADLDKKYTELNKKADNIKYELKKFV